jgi:hypothetical protein
MVKATPVLSPVISLFTSVLGDLVGKGPSVSVGETVQLLLLEESVPEEELELSSLLPEFFLQLPASGAMAASPKAANPFFKKSFLSIVI